VVRVGGKRYGLTCEHVVYGAQARAEVRSYSYRSRRIGGVIGEIARTGGLVVGGHLNQADYALLELSTSTWVSGRFPEPIGRLSPGVFSTKGLAIRASGALDGAVPVQMIGAKSRWVAGVASGVFTPVTFRLDDGRFEFVRFAPICIEVTAVPEQGSQHIDFCDEGDSGALVVTREPGGGRPRPLGLLISKSADRSDGGPIMRRGYAVPVERVLSAISGGTISVSIEG